MQTEAQWTDIIVFLMDRNDYGGNHNFFPCEKNYLNPLACIIMANYGLSPSATLRYVILLIFLDFLFPEFANSKIMSPEMSLQNQGCM